jgi:hypothetical protein
VAWWGTMRRCNSSPAFEKDTTAVYGDQLPKGTALFFRQDFDTVENPFEFSSGGPVSPTPLPGVHFIVFAPSAQLFEKIRKEMDGVDLQKKYVLPNENTGFLKVLTTTHRQNYLEPPRSHRSFPLAENDLGFCRPCSVQCHATPLRIRYAVTPVYSTF